MEPAAVSIQAVNTEPQLSDLAALAGQIWRAYYPGIISREQIEYMLARMYAPATLHAEVHQENIRFYQLLLRGHLTGFAAIGPTTHAGIFKLHKLYLRPEMHGFGLGKQLLHHCETEVVRLGAHSLRLGVNKRNLRALAFYQRQGYGVIESVVNDIGGGFVMDDYLMGKPLVR